MRTNLAPALTQDWMCVGLDRWQQSIAKREASRIALEINSVVLQWSVRDEDSFVARVTHLVRAAPLYSQTPQLYSQTAPPYGQVSTAHREQGDTQASRDLDDWGNEGAYPQIVLISRKALERSLNLIGGDHMNLSLDMYRRLLFSSAGIASTVLLLWDWGLSGRSSLEWATSLGFSGVIFNFSTLRSWSRVAVERLPCTLKELHPLVATLSPDILIKPQNPLRKSS